MNDRLQVPPRLGIADDPLPEKTAVQFTVVADNAVSEAFDHLFQHGGTRRHGLAGKPVQIDDNSPQRLEPAANRRLAGTGSSGNGDSQGASLPMAAAIGQIGDLLQG